MLASSLWLLSDVSVALLIEESGQIHVGSGLLVRLDDGDGETPGRVVVATAGHNLEGVAGPRAVRVVPRGRYRADPLRATALGLPPRGGPDVAWIEVDAAEVDRRGLGALHLSYLTSATSQWNRPDVDLTVYGYPACRVEGPSIHGTRFNLLAATVAASRVVCDHRPDDVAVRWTVGLPASAAPFHPKGLSGCGIWARMGGTPRPVALARAWHGGRGVLYCTPIGAWLDWIGEPSLRRRNSR